MCCYMQNVYLTFIEEVSSIRMILRYKFNPEFFQSQYVQDDRQINKMFIAALTMDIGS